MSKSFYANFKSGEQRWVASHSNKRADLFFDLTRVAEKYVNLPSGITFDGDDYNVDPDVFIHFFDTFWKTETGWLSELDDLLVGWSSRAAGIVQNITLQPTRWFDRKGEELLSSRFGLDDQAYEQEFCDKRERGDIHKVFARTPTDMAVSLKEFIRVGTFGFLDFGMSRTTIEELLGPPDTWGPTPKHKEHAAIWKYGDFEFHFSVNDGTLCGIYMEDFTIPTASRFLVNPWIVSGKLTCAEAEVHLQAAGISYQKKEDTNNENGFVITSSVGTRLTFCGEGPTLHALGRAIDLGNEILPRKHLSIRRVIERLTSALGTNAFEIVNYWQGDLCAIGIARPGNHEHLVYICTYGKPKHHYAVSLEYPPAYHYTFPRRPAENFDDVEFDALLELARRHLGCD